MQPYQTVLKYLHDHDPFSYAHSLRVGQMFERVVDSFGIRMDRDEAIAGAYLHDMGKTFIPVDVLTKPTRLDREEWETMQGHAALGGKFLKFLGFPKRICDMARYHHERKDGRGYFRKTDLPVHIEILSVCDSFVSMTEDRVYRKGMPHEKAWGILLKAKGQFPKQLVYEVKCALQESKVQFASGL